MRVLIMTAGSRGDVQPYVALGKGLLAAGHKVTICTPSRYESFVADHGLAYAHLGDDLVQLLDTAEGRGAMEDLGSLVSGIKTGVKLLRRSGPIQRLMLEEGWEAARRVDPDVILYNSKMGGAPHYADKLDIPVVLTMLFPQFVPTASFPTLGFPPRGERFNRWTYSVVHTIAGAVGGRYVRAWREAHGLPRQPRGVDLLHRNDGSRIPVLHGMSPHVVPEPPDWPPDAIMSGYWFLDYSDDWVPPPALEAFLATGEPPVYVGFGSMSGRNPERTTQIVVEALRQAGVRGILATGWGGMAPTTLPETLFTLDRAPHDWLFPRVSAVVHHGGAGTTAAGLRAGRPTVICPFFGDQPFWGRCVHKLGVGSAPIPQKKLTSERLAAAIREVTTDEAIRTRAKAMGARIRNEDGIARAVEFVEQVAQA